MNSRNLFIYLFYIAISFLIFFVDNYFGLLVSIFGYVLLFLLNYKKNKTIFNYIQFYLLTCWILSITQVFNLYNYDENIFYEERLYFFYCVIITGLISTFFKSPDNNLLITNLKKKKIDFKYLNHFLFFFWLLSILSIDGFFGNIIQYIFKHILFLSPIILTSILYLNSTKKVFPIVIFFLTFVYYTSIMFNRTGFLLVPIFFFITVLIERNLSINFSKNYRFILGTVILIFFTLVISDLYKGSSTRNFYSFLSQLTINDFKNFSSETRYQINPVTNVYDYFSILGSLTDDKRELGGNIFSQFISIAKPRFFFPEKQITNISELLFIQRYTSNRLFFSIFLESTYNLGLFGVLIYHLLILIVGKIMFNSLLIINNKLVFQFLSVHYFFYVFYLYTLIRGPGIHFIPYFFFCFCFMLYFLYLLKISRKKNRSNI